MQGKTGLLAFGGTVAGAALIGSIFTPARGKTRRWYASLEKAPFNPPNAIFGPVWTLLYVMIAVSGFRVSRGEPGAARSASLRLWAAQMTLNGSWSPLFFGLKKPGLALLDQALLLPAILAYIRTARRVDKLASQLTWPYAVWVMFATVLNAEIVRRNA